MVIIPPPVTTAATGAVPAALPAATPGPGDVQRFETALSPPRVTIGPLEAAPLTQPDPVINTPSALGDRILASVEKMRVAYHDGLGRMDVTMRKKPVQASDMMRLLVDTMQISLQQDILSKAVGSSTQNLNTLLKGQ
jgi:type III secretion system YscI/HrpB-like protein